MLIADVAVRDAVLVGLMIVGPLIGSARLSPRTTAALAGIAIGVSLVRSFAGAEMGAMQQLASLAVAIFGSLMAVWVAVLRAGREAATRRVRAQHAVARVGAESRTLVEAAPRMLAGIADTLGWDLGVLWELDPDRGVLRPTASWHAGDRRCDSFVADTEAVSFASGEGLPGRVLESAQPAWIVDVTADPNFPRSRAAAAAGLCSAFAFPLRVRDHVVGAMEFFSRSRRAPDAELLRTMATFGTQVGTYVEVKRAEQAVHDSEALKTAILETALDAIVTIDAEGHIVEFNPAAERILGHARSAVIGREMGELIVPAELREAHRAGLARQAAGEPSRILGQRLEMPALRADGTVIPVELAISRIDSDPPLFAGHLRDISDRLAAEHELRRSRDQLEAILGHLADAVTVQDRTGRIIYANPAAARQTGVASADDVIGEHAGDAIARIAMADEEGRPLSVDDLPARRILRGEEPRELVVRHRLRAAGEERWSIVKSSPIRDAGGELALVVSVFEDITEHKRSEIAQRFLAEASRALGASLDWETTLDNVARLAVPEIADWCAIDILGADGRLARVAIVHADPDLVARAEELRRRYPPKPDEQVGVMEVLRTGSARLYPELPDEVVRAAAHDEEHLRLLREFGICSVIIAPLRGLDRPLGAITFVSAESRRRFDEHDLALAQELAQRAGTAIENARIYSDRARIARTLQRSLLPPSLPIVPGIELAARYRAAAEGSDVGGDFYDVFQVGDGCWGVVVGDVCGKGPEAAAITALARYTVRALALHERSPQRILELLNEALLRQRTDRQFCTVAYAHVDLCDPGAPRVSLACGGHPPPLVIRRDGSVEPAGPSGTLLGVLRDPEIAASELELRADELLLFYTDGVTDARVEGGLLGLEGLMSVAARMAGQDAAVAAELVEAAVAPPGAGTLRDDVAILVVRNASGEGARDAAAVTTRSEAGVELDVRLPASPAAVGLARQALDPLAERLGAGRLDDLRLLVSELVTNAVRHGEVNGADWVGVTVTSDGDRLRVDVSDPGTGFAPEVAREVVPARRAAGVPGGWGLFLVERLAERWGVERGERTTVWFELDAR